MAGHAEGQRESGHEAPGHQCGDAACGDDQILHDEAARPAGEGHEGVGRAASPSRTDDDVGSFTARPSER